MTDHPLHPWAITHLASFTDWQEEPAIHLLHGSPARSTPLTHSSGITDLATTLGKLTKSFTCTEHSSTVVRRLITLPADIKGVAIVDQGMFQLPAGNSARTKKARFLVASTPSGAPLALVQPHESGEGPWPVDAVLSPSLNPGLEMPEPLAHLHSLLANLASAVALHATGLEL